MSPPPATAAASPSTHKDVVLNEDAWAGEILSTIARARTHLDQKQQEAADKRKQKTMPKSDVIVQEEESGKEIEKEPTTTTALSLSSISTPVAPIQSMPLPQQPIPQPLHAPSALSSLSPSLPPPPPSFLLSPLDIRRAGAALLPAALPPPLPRRRLPSLTQLPH